MPGNTFSSPNFAFLGQQNAHLLRLASQAEAFCFKEPDLELSGLASRENTTAFHLVRKSANAAVRSGEATQSQALQSLKLTRAIAIWFHRLKHPTFQPGPFTAPLTPVDAREALTALTKSGIR
ncbi:hypothetical protein FEM03_06185 [Phragmitibacter flavus]|uniref:Uncharacterized protein n=1 Tax=Phragmitibacter flavus TaxID=2576071 RepID=A0A5R8KHD8_9BACT|nr:hypothetical protein [Phragmitibacter flavus]TLD71724.1 hypothetical protein FEM03_06185 [Phragmitibacter flavus]